MKMEEGFVSKIEYCGWLRRVQGGNNDLLDTFMPLNDN